MRRRPACRMLLIVVAAAHVVACRRAENGGPTTVTPPDAIAGPAAAFASAGTDPATPAVTLLAGGRPPARVAVRIARTPAERARGLMYVQHLPPDEGMLFLSGRDEDQVFWMKNTLIPLDMIFIRADLTVAGVVEQAQPLTLESRSIGARSRFVLEVNGGWARAHGVAAGTPVVFENVAP